MNINPYEMLWDNWRARTKKLAAADPEWAAIQAKRGPDGSIFLNDELTIADYEKQGEIEDRLSPMPWYLRGMLHMKPTRHPRANPLTWKRWATHFYQRARRGYSDRDVWNLDGYLARVIAGSVRQLGERAHGWPGEPMTFAEWQQICRDIADGFEAGALHDADDPEHETELQAKFDKGFDLFRKYYHHLWD